MMTEDEMTEDERAAAWLTAMGCGPRLEWEDVGGDNGGEFWRREVDDWCLDAYPSGAGWVWEVMNLGSSVGDDYRGGTASSAAAARAAADAAFASMGVA